MGKRSLAVDRFLQHTPVAHHHALLVIRDIIHTIQPDVQESVQYNMALFDYHGMLCSFASEPHSIHLYCLPEVVERYRAHLGATAGTKGSIRFKTLHDIPLDTLRALLTECSATLAKRAQPLAH